MLEAFFIRFHFNFHMDEMDELLFVTTEVQQNTFFLMLSCMCVCVCVYFFKFTFAFICTRADLRFNHTVFFFSFH